MIRYFLALVCMVNLCAYEMIPDQTTLPLLNPSFHDQKIEKLQLPNGLQAVLVSDPHAKQSAVTMTVLAGSWQEPDAYHGLAHFLEHMLFMGTSEYPDESSFTRFLTQHGGQTNAYTHGDYTSYMFALNTDGFAEGLKRFASFFKSPLFNPSGVSRELNAIDQEFAQGFNSEDVRQYNVIKQLASKKHPFSRFQIGNSQTLAHATTDDLRQWFQDHYSANLMKLYVLSSDPIEKIRELVIEDFSGIPNTNKARYSTTTPLFDKNARGTLVRIAPQGATQSLTLAWEVPSEISGMLQSRPTDLLCAALGYEGKNSLLAELKQEGLADSLVCSPIDIASYTYLFEIDIKLTTKGLAEVDTVIERVFQTLNMIRKTPYPQFVYDDFAEMLKQKYQFQQRTEPFDWAMEQAAILAQEPIATYPELTKTLHSFNPEGLKTLLQALTPENVIVLLTATGQKFTHKEPWMQIPYAIEPIPPSKLKQWAEAVPLATVTYPLKNPFLAHSPQATSALLNKNEYPLIPSPKAIVDTPGAKIYYGQDPFYQVPRTALYLQVQTPAIKDGRPRTVVMAEIYVKALKDALRDIVDEALMADLEVTIDRAMGSLFFTMEGFTESLISFFPYLKLAPLELSPEKFELIKEDLLRDYENHLKGSPIKQSFDHFKKAIFAHYSTFNQKKRVISKITYSAFQNFQEHLFKQTYLKGLIVGSLNEEEAKKLIEPLNQTLHKEPGSYAAPYYPKIKSEKGPSAYTFATQAEGDALFLALETDQYTPRLRNVQEMLSQVMAEAFFNELRTKQQTGYIVMSDTLETQKHLFTYFGAQSTNYTPDELLWRFELFIETYLNNLKELNISKERFEILKSSLINQIKIPPATLQLFGEQNFRLAFDTEDFDWNKKRLDDLNAMTYEEFIEAALPFLSRSNHRRIAILIDGQLKKAPFEYKRNPPIKKIKQLAR